VTLTKKRGFKPPFLKGIIKKMSDFKLRPFKAEPIQNPKSGDTGTKSQGSGVGSESEKAIANNSGVTR
jgi:hypothetical protein